ncbi:hypothetical protein ACF1AJ_15765 [Leifsonia sp. NPDC014704]|uniref:DUF7507 domain-containing protein n=1 Tax=Leifsonia sp. NPDC014704 TaxID=3364123 RepID=UPI0036F46A0C
MVSTLASTVARIGVALAATLSVAGALASVGSPAGAAGPACAPDPGFASCVVFASHGVDQRFDVPDGVSSILIKLWGAGGGGEAQPSTVNHGGGGGYAEGELAVSPGDSLLVIVGSGGSSGRSSAAPVGAYGGGGAGGPDPYSSYRGGSGGGRSAVQLQAGADAITAGGGGGKGGATAVIPPIGNGGGGGGLVGESGGGNGPGGSGGCKPVPGAGGGGGTQDAGGAGGISAAGWGGSAGTRYLGGAGGPSSRSNAGAGGGGGGGYFGAGGGAGNGYGCAQEGAGGGGSGYVGGVQGGFTIAATGAAPAHTDDRHYVSGVGTGGGGLQAGGNGLVVLQFSAAPSVTKAFTPAHIVAGDSATLSIALTNPNTGPLIGMELTDSLPPGVVVSAGPSANTCGGVLSAAPGQSEVRLSGGTIPAATATLPGSCTIEVQVTSDTAGTYVNTIPAGAVSTADGVGNAAPASATLGVDAATPALTLVKSSSVTTEEQYVAGDTITFFFVVTNSGNVPLTDVSVDETQFTGSGSAPVPSCPGLVAPLPVGHQLTCTAEYTITPADVAAGALRNDAVASATTTTGARVASAPSTVVVPAAPFASATLEKTVTPATAGAGAQATYRYTITNTGNEALHSIAVVEDSFSGTGTAPDPTCPEETLYAGQQLVCTAVYTVTQDDVDAQSLIANTAHATAMDATDTGLRTDPSTAQLGVPAAAPAIQLKKTVTSAWPVPAVFVSGDALTYHFVLTNTGNVTLSSLVLTEVAFDGHGAVILDCSALGAQSLSPGESATCAGTYSVDQADIDSGATTIANTAEATAVDPQGAPVPVSRSTSVAVLAPVSALSLTKTGTPDAADQHGRVVVGTSIEWSFVVGNTGATTIAGVAVTDPLGGAVECDVTVLAPGATTVCHARRPHIVSERDAAAGSVDNIARATGDTLFGLHVASEPAGVSIPVAPAVLIPPVSPGDPQVEGPADGQSADAQQGGPAVSALATTGGRPPISAWPGLAMALVGLAFVGHSLRKRRDVRRPARGR